MTGGKEMINRKPGEGESQSDINKRNIEQKDEKPRSSNDLHTDWNSNNTNTHKNDNDLNNNSENNSSQNNDSPYPPGFKGE
jgi:hypothetical protein